MSDDEDKGAEHHLLWVAGMAFIAWLQWDNTSFYGLWPKIWVFFGFLHLIKFIKKLNLDGK
jgi:hypothetical protein